MAALESREIVAKEQHEKHEKFVGHFLSKERTCAKKGMKVKEKRKGNVRGVFLFFPSFQS